MTPMEDPNKELILKNNDQNAVAKFSSEKVTALSFY